MQQVLFSHKKKQSTGAAAGSVGRASDSGGQGRAHKEVWKKSNSVIGSTMDSAAPAWGSHGGHASQQLLTGHRTGCVL